MALDGKRCEDRAGNQREMTAGTGRRSLHLTRARPPKREAASQPTRQAAARPIMISVAASVLRRPLFDVVANIALAASDRPAVFACCRFGRGIGGSLPFSSRM